MRGLPKFVNEEARKEINKLRKKIPTNKERLSLRNYLLDRKFVAQHLNALFEGQKDLIVHYPISSIKDVDKNILEDFSVQINE